MAGKQGGQWQEFRLNIAMDDFDGEVGDRTNGAQLWWKPDWRSQQNYPGSGTFTRR